MFFVPGTPASAAAAPSGSGCLPADVPELAAPLGRPSRAAGALVVKVAKTAPAGRRDGGLQPGRIRRQHRRRAGQAGPQVRQPAGRRSRPTSPARTLSRPGQPPAWPLGAEDLHGAREAPVAARDPQRHQPAQEPRPAAPHAARHRTALRRQQGARRHAHEDLRGRARRQPEDLAADEAPAAAEVVGVRGLVAWAARGRAEQR